MSASPEEQLSSNTSAGRLDEQLCFALYAATNAITRRYRPLLSSIGLTYPQFLVLLILWENDDCSIGSIAERLGLASHAVSPIIDRLEHLDLVLKGRDQNDGRVSLIRLTPSGRSLEASAAEVQDAIRCTTHLADDEIHDLRSRLHALAAEYRETATK